ncbi:hypothetical protein RND81_02G201900 [Saponaria officinalis]|uniref:Uncharacterized protein n=1 Tax=Saponaria officinalis TaxID=3572 RepID=A0AAW1MSH1_SAPOF
MGLLIIDYENLVSSTEELGQEFAKAQEILKREKAANLIAISEAEQREENLKKALHWLCENRRILKEREEKLHEIDRTSKEKEAYIDELQQMIDSADATLKKMKLDMEIKLADLISKEKKAETLRCKLDMTERELLEKEEKLKARESLENLLKKHKTELDAKLQEFELETKKRRNAMEEELSTRMQEIDARRKQALEKKSERVKEKEKDIDGTIAALKEREKSVKAEEKSLELEKKQINADKEGINLRKQEHLIEQEQKELEVLQEERSNYLRLQTNLKQEIEIARQQPSHHSEANDTPTEVSARTSVSPNAINRNNLKSGGQMSVLRKRASIIFKSPKDGSQPTDTSGKSPISAAPSTATKNGFNNIDYGSDEGKLRTQNSAADGHGQSFRIVNDSPNNSRLDVSVREDSINTAPSVDVSNIANVEQSVQESEDIVSKTSRRKPGRKREGGVRRTYSVKAVIADAKAIVSEGSPGKMEVQPNNFAGAEASNYEDSMEGEIKPPRGRKRSRLQASRVTESEQEVEHSEGIADSATTGGRRKRRQTASGPTCDFKIHLDHSSSDFRPKNIKSVINLAAAALQTPGQRRYNLRRHTAKEHKNEDDTASKDTEQTVQNPHDTPGPSFNAAVDSGSRLNLVRISTTKSIEISSDRIVKFSAADMANNRIDAAKSLHSASLREAKSGENKLISEEVNENKDDPIDDERVGDEGEDTDEEDGDDSDGHPGQASMGKKLWNFFTT